jgi:hypothetical protein
MGGAHLPLWLLQADADRALQEQREKEARAAQALERSIQAARPKVLEQAAAQAEQQQRPDGAGAADASEQPQEQPAPQAEGRRLLQHAGAEAVPAGEGTADRGGTPAAAAARAAPLAPLDADARLAEVREALRAMVSEARALAAAHPEAGVLEVLEAAGFKVPPADGRGTSRVGSRAGSEAGSVAGSRAASRAGSVRSCGGSGSGTAMVAVVVGDGLGEGSALSIGSGASGGSSGRSEAGRAPARSVRRGRPGRGAVAGAAAPRPGGGS